MDEVNVLIVSPVGDDEVCIVRVLLENGYWVHVDTDCSNHVIEFKKV